MHSTNASLVLFVRHAHTTALGEWLCGRAGDIALSARGQAQAIDLARALRMTPLAAIYSSPLARARATASAIAAQQSCEMQTSDELDEIDFGRWTGMTFAELENDPEWRAFNRSRSTAVVPDGEQLNAAQTRIVAAAADLAAIHRGQAIALVTHAEIVRLALLHYQGRSIDCYQTLTIEPASVSAVQLSRFSARVLFINECFHS
jgi:broad specificity phosphatase PhoE